MKIYLVILGVLALEACQSNQQTQPQLQVQTQTYSADSTYTMADLAVEGMMCAHACGGKVQQELRKMPGVKNTQLDFIEERKVNVVHVQFDPIQVDELKMAAVINTIADGKYKVVSAQRNEFVKP